MNKKFYVTTPIYYVNATPHLGHAYTTILADAQARFFRLNGYDTFFLTGTDEHGDKIARAAAKENISPKEYADKISSIFYNTWKEMNITFDNYIRTTAEYHIYVVQEILKKVYLKGDIYFGTHGGYYCTGCERFYTEKEWVIENGNPSCPDHQTSLELIKEKNYFFKMEQYRPWLLKHIKDNPDFIRPERYRNEILSYLSEPIGDLCISRPKERLTWGIPLPFDDNYVTYVWFDALINYISGLGWPDGTNYKKYWPVAQHIVAKDILKPHAVFWPTMLKSAEIPLYHRLNVHGYWMMDTSKMSKSLDNVVRPLQMKEKYGEDSFRYYLLRDMTFGVDADFREENLIQRLNSELANDLGNLLSRTTGMTKKYFDSLIPEPSELNDEDKNIIESVLQLRTEIFNHMTGFFANRALEEIWKNIRSLNKYVDFQAPWKLKKEDNIERLQTVIYVLLESIRIIGIMLQPFIPESSKKIFESLGLKDTENILFDDGIKWGLLESGKEVKPGIILFKKIINEQE